MSDIITLLRKEAIETPVVPDAAPPPVVRDPNTLPPQISERDALMDTYINNNNLIARFRDRFNIIERAYYDFTADGDVIEIDSRIKRPPLSSTREMVLQSFKFELERLTTNITTLRNSDKLLPQFLTNRTNQDALNQLLLDIQQLYETIERDIAAPPQQCAIL